MTPAICAMIQRFTGWGILVELKVELKTAVFDSGEVTLLIKDLQESTRASPNKGDDKYVPVAGAEVATADYHHFVYGQRGAGKSSLLRYLEKEAQAKQRLSVWIDQEIFSNLQYPDVLVSAVTLVFEAALDLVSAKQEKDARAAHWFKRLLRSSRGLFPLRAKKADMLHQLTQVAAELQLLKFAPIDRKIEWVQADSKSTTHGGKIGLTLPHLALGGSTEAITKSDRQSKETIEGTKDQYLERALVDLRRVLLKVSELHGGGIIVIDDL